VSARGKSFTGRMLDGGATLGTGPLTAASSANDPS
jgi:hypothetical protein